jgi:hypothetical protein
MRCKPGLKVSPKAEKQKWYIFVNGIIFSLDFFLYRHCEELSVRGTTKQSHLVSHLNFPPWVIPSHGDCLSRCCHEKWLPLMRDGGIVPKALLRSKDNNCYFNRSYSRGIRSLYFSAHFLNVSSSGFNERDSFKSRSAQYSFSKSRLT